MLYCSDHNKYSGEFGNLKSSEYELYRYVTGIFLIKENSQQMQRAG
jgi:hypothetical protein